jgi:hypothetical protein
MLELLQRRPEETATPVDEHRSEAVLDTETAQTLPDTVADQYPASV